MVSMTPWYRLMALDAAEKQMASMLRLKWQTQFHLYTMTNLLDERIDQHQSMD